MNLGLASYAADNQDPDHKTNVYDDISWVALGGKIEHKKSLYFRAYLLRTSARWLLKLRIEWPGYMREFTWGIISGCCNFTSAVYYKNHRLAGRLIHDWQVPLLISAIQNSTQKAIDTLLKGCLLPFVAT